MVNRKDSLTKTFRLDKRAFDLLEQEASKNGRSTNDIINRLVLRELEGERLLRPLKLVRISSQSLKLFTQALSQEKIAEIGQEVASGVITDSLSMQSAGLSLRCGDEKQAGTFQLQLLDNCVTSPLQSSSRSLKGVSADEKLRTER